MQMDQARSCLSTPLILVPQKSLNLSTFADTEGLHQGVGGAGALPAFHGVGGAGALPAFHGVGGAGADPAAIITEPSACAVTNVFRPIAPTKTTITSKTTASFLDILPPGMENTRRHSIPNYRDVK